MHVLIVEDNPWYGEYLQRVLTRRAISSQITGDAIAALTAIDERRPDSIVLDVFLPGPNGFVLLHELRSHADIGRIPVVLYTQNTERLSLQELRSYGVGALLDKATTTPEIIVRSLREVCHEHA